MDSSQVFAEHIVGIGYEDLPPQVIEITKRSILDTLGVILAATTLGESGVKEIVALVRDAGGKEESTILGFGTKVPALSAALANGVIAHQLDYDDCFDEGVVHPGSGTVPAALAIAERQGNITGKEFITAVALGADIICRLSLPLTRGNFDYGWARVGTFNKYGAAAAAGKLLGLSKAQMVSAFGIVLNQAAMSNASSFDEGSDMRAIRDGFGAQAGVLSALFAAKGIVGDQDSIDGKYGLYNICFLGDSDPAKVTAELGKKFFGTEVSFKPWPCCRNIHAFLEAALLLVKEHGLKPDDITNIITVTGGRRKSYYESMDERRRPKTGIDARYSTPFVLGAAIARGDILLEDFTIQGRENPVVLELAEKVTYRFDETYKRLGMEIGVVEIVTKGGATYSREIPFAYGHPQNPISKEDLIKKFKDCAGYALKPLTDRQTAAVITAVDHLEDIRDMREIIKLMH